MFTIGMPVYSCTFGLEKGNSGACAKVTRSSSGLWQTTVGKSTRLAVRDQIKCR
jgi:hypothetical protein